MSVVGCVDARIQVSQLFAQLAYRGLTPINSNGVKREMAEREQWLWSWPSPI